MTFFDSIKAKIQSVDEIKRALERERLLNKKIVFTNGCFDLIHLGHIDYLAKARDLGDVLVVGVNTDKSVKKLKGYERPLQDEVSRCMILSAMSFVDYVVMFDEDTPLMLIKSVMPDVLVKGGDYEIKDIVGANIVKEKGGQVMTLPFLNGYSTTNIVNKIKSF